MGIERFSVLAFYRFWICNRRFGSPSLLFFSSFFVFVLFFFWIYFFVFFALFEKSFLNLRCRAFRWIIHDCWKLPETENALRTFSAARHWHWMCQRLYWMDDSVRCWFGQGAIPVATTSSSTLTTVSDDSHQMERMLKHAASTMSPATMPGPRWKQINFRLSRFLEIT